MMAQHLSDLDVFRTANTWLDLHGENAIAKAREMSALFRAKGDDEGADTWLRIIVAIGTLVQERTGSLS